MREGHKNTGTRTADGLSDEGLSPGIHATLLEAVCDAPLGPVTWNFTIAAHQEGAQAGGAGAPGRRPRASIIKLDLREAVLQLGLELHKLALEL